MDLWDRALLWANAAIMRLLEHVPIFNGEVWVMGRMANYLGQDSELLLEDLKDGHTISVFLHEFEHQRHVEGRGEFVWEYGMECHVKGVPTWKEGRVIQISDPTELVVMYE